jgi:hypothetical protein
MNDYGTKLNIPELVKSIKDTDILDLNNKRLISSTNFYDMYKKGQISGIIDDEDAINFINDKYAWKIDEEDEERKEKDEEKKLFLDDIEEKYKERQKEKDLAQKVLKAFKNKVVESKLDKKAKEAYIENLKKRYIGKLKGEVEESKELGNREGKFITKTKKKYFDALKNYTSNRKEKEKKQEQLREELVANQVVDGAIKRFKQSGLSRKFLSPSTPSNEPKNASKLTPERPPQINPYRVKNAPVYIPVPTPTKKNVQTLFKAVGEKGTKQEVWDGTAKYHENSKGVKLYKADLEKKKSGRVVLK